jgi:ketosteroid isomerase-like protein
MLAIHSAYENITVEGDSRPRAAVAVTNVFLRTGGGWRIILHHGSPTPPEPRAPGDSPKILH